MNASYECAFRLAVPSDDPERYRIASEVAVALGARLVVQHDPAESDSAWWLYIEGMRGGEALAALVTAGLWPTDAVPTLQ